VCCNFSHQLSFGGSRGLKPTVLGKTCKGWHFYTSVSLFSVYLCFFAAPGSPDQLQRKMDLQEATAPDHDSVKNPHPVPNLPTERRYELRYECQYPPPQGRQCNNFSL
jgi:hypothetical protein